MQRRDGTLIYSPSDLTEFMESPFASWMSRFALDHPEVKPGADLEAQLFQQHGIRHEERVLARMKDDLGLDVAMIDTDQHPEEAKRQSREAIAARRDVVYQARLECAPFIGIADFLVHPRVAARITGEDQDPDATSMRPAGLDEAPYEVWDAKLSHSAKPSHLVQLCAYVEMLEAVQLPAADQLVVALGSGTYFRARVADSFYYYRSVKRAFLAAMEAYDENACPVPDATRKHGRWDAAAKADLEQRDHTSRVARLSRGQSLKLSKAGIDTLGALAGTTVASVPGIAAGMFARLREQAQLQRDSAPGEPPQYRVLDASEVQAGKGLWSLPEFSDGDVFFDIEGDPLADDGLEYLWGVACRTADGEPAYRAFWAHDAKQEQRVYEDFIDWVCARRVAYPDLHVYHYAPYELNVIKRLMGRTGSREAEVNGLLLDRVFVDLYQVMRHGVRVGEPAYSIKNIEKLYRGVRETDVTGGLGSVVEYEKWKGSGEGAIPEDSPILESIRAYNEDDCVSTLELDAWLRDRQRESDFEYQSPQISKDTEEKIQERREKQEKQRLLVDELAGGLGAEPAQDDPSHPHWRVQKLLAELVEFYSREAKPVWWEMYDRASMTEDERAEQWECLAGLQRTARPRFEIKKSLGFEYAFDPEQATRIGVGSRCWLAQDTTLEVAVEEIDLANGTIILKVTQNKIDQSQIEQMPDRLCLIRFEYVASGVMEESIAEMARAWLDEDGFPPALRGYLVRTPPKIRGHTSGALRRPDEPLRDALQRITMDLEESALSVQGPPGSGKTTLGAAAICSLVEAGMTVAITANSHKVIENLMQACGKEARRRGSPIRLVKAGSNKAQRTVGGEPDAIGCTNGKVADHLQPGSVVGGTAWCFGRKELAGAFDHLFVDEAGQVSVANLVAVARCARNLVLLGDPAQLGQPLRGIHPGESGLSTLDYVMPAGRAVLDGDRGLFLEKTHRLHPRVCEFISESFYEGQLEPADGNERRVLFPSESVAPGEFSEVGSDRAGIHFISVAHDGNRQSSVEEVAVIERLFNQLIGRRFRQRSGDDESEQHLTEDDILIVAPYNLQVSRLEEALPQALIGTVDKFQGQQAAVVVLSLCASDADVAPRGIEFLLSPNRLNVALSRAQCMAIVVGSPRVATAACTTVRQMTMVNRICRVVG